MNALAPLIQIAGVVQLLILAANFALPKRLALDRFLPRLSPILRQMFLVHWIYILIVILLFSGVSLIFPDDLAGGSGLGRAFSAALALFWTSRLVVQLLYYDRAFLHRHRAGHLVFTAAFAYLGGVFALAALGVIR